MTFMTRPRASIWFEFFGRKDGKIITLVNGHTRSSSDFRVLTRHAEQAGLGVLLLDNRASGKSSVEGPFTLLDMKDDILGIWNELGIEKSSVLGISMGGCIAQSIAILHPERIDRLVLVSTAPDQKWIRSTGGGWLNEGSNIEQKLETYFAEGFVEKNKVLFEAMVKQTRAAIANGNFTERSNLQRDALKDLSWLGRLHEIQAPTLIIHGDRDRVVDLEAAHVLQRDIPKAELMIVEGAGHLLLAEAPKALYDASIQFVNES